MYKDQIIKDKNIEHDPDRKSFITTKIIDKQFRTNVCFPDCNICLQTIARVQKKEADLANSKKLLKLLWPEFLPNRWTEHIYLRKMLEQNKIIAEVCEENDIGFNDFAYTDSKHKFGHLTQDELNRLPENNIREQLNFLETLGAKMLDAVTYQKIQKLCVERTAFLNKM